MNKNHVLLISNTHRCEVSFFFFFLQDDQLPVNICLYIRTVLMIDLSNFIPVPVVNCYFWKMINHLSILFVKYHLFEFFLFSRIISMHHRLCCISSDEKKSRKRTHVFVCLFHLPRTSFSLVLSLCNSSEYIYSRESIAHQLHHLIYFYKRKKKRETDYSCVVTGARRSQVHLFTYPNILYPCV